MGVLRWSLSVDFGIMQNDLKNDWYGIESYADLIDKVFHPLAVIQLEGCYTAYNSSSIAYEFKRILPASTVTGYTGLAAKLPFVWETAVHPLEVFNRNSHKVTLK